MTFEELKKRIDLANIKCKGCAPDEISEFEKKENIALPFAYKTFLKICGKNCEDLFCSETINLDNWDYIQESGRSSYVEALKTDCPRNILFIMEHHGYSHYYIDLNEGDNPSIFLLINGDEISIENIGYFEDLLNTKITNFEKNNALQQGL